MPTKVLIVDDLVLERTQTKTILSTFGGELPATMLPLEFFEADNGAKAVELAAKLQPAVILMDVVMPQMDGFQALRAIREAERTGGNRATPIIMVTTKNRAPDRMNAEDSGASAFVSKPTDANREELAKVFKSCLLAGATP